MIDSKHREALAEALGSRMAVGTSGRWIVEYGETPESLADALSPVLAQIQAEAERKGAAGVVAAVEAVCDEADALTQEAVGHVIEHWRGSDFIDGRDVGIEATTSAVRSALSADRAESEGAAR